ncbi:MAG: hypothetical protein VW935_07210 [Novosphingobium sp.]
MIHDEVCDTDPSSGNRQRTISFHSESTNAQVAGLAILPKLWSEAPGLLYAHLPRPCGRIFWIIPGGGGVVRANVERKTDESGSTAA